jgi:uncharacterized protein (DUF433 family)
MIDRKKIEMRPNREGRARAFISGTRIRVQDIYALAEVQGKNPDEIVQALPSLTLSQVHAALSYYFDHRDAIMQEAREDEDFVRNFREKSGPGPLEQRLKLPHAKQAEIPVVRVVHRREILVEPDHGSV